MYSFAEFLNPSKQVVVVFENGSTLSPTSLTNSLIKKG
ncbi:hypothetical protein M23134_02793 [Microscilla marina ATCC 23134]|uniref:Uncharacterized protein n=1 Tax=Microscilla marina ATCC 23134 TaxID=313606 RepID=A1ZPP1_MICM2|nr:hypothetical protein M23134_02793 [Microscilla marina ATCC 23134]